MDKIKTTEEFIQKARSVHGDKYDYSLTEFKNTKSKITIICPEHGAFVQRAGSHLYNGAGCPICAKKKSKTTEEFLEEVKLLPNIEELSFENTHYVKCSEKIKIYCHHKDEKGIEHGEFEITPQHFLDGEGCPKCRYIKSAASKRRSLSEVIKLANEIHGNKYDYSLIKEYKNDRTKYPIVCPEHGVFYQTFNSHLKGKQGCPICGRKKCDEKRMIPFDEFVKRANIVHYGKYSYSPDGFTTMSDKVRITCPSHGDFYQTGINHVDLGYGCPKCGCIESKGETEIYEFLCSLVGKEKVIKKDRSILTGKLEIDSYIPSMHFGVEFNGLRWHSELIKDKNYHLSKTKECEEKGIRLFHVFEDEWYNQQEIIKSMIKNILGFTENKIYARNCSVKELSMDKAKQFLNENHLQGYCVSKWRLGLYHNDELVSVMTFGKSRHFVGNNDNCLELLRFANKMNTEVIGGASKLFSYFIKHYAPKEVVSYADRRWSNGNLYNVLGFQKYNESKPNYFYIIGKNRVYRFNLRKSVLVKKYGCPQDMSEKDFCLKQKWYRIYDCGCLCYKWISPAE